jgi:hypothetical protein
MVKDLRKAGVEFTDEGGRRRDFHALRHTFSTNLDRAGCSHATRKALLRHADTDVTDGYSHARLAELAEAVKRLPVPAAAMQLLGMTAVNGGFVQDLRRSYTGHRGFISLHFGSRDCTLLGNETPSTLMVVNGDNSAAMHVVAQSRLPLREALTIVQYPRPSTQVD